MIAEFGQRGKRTFHILFPILKDAIDQQSDGHILVVRGFDSRGDVIVNDPAQPAVRHVYPRAAFARCWLDHGGVALLVAPPERCDDLVRCANA